MPEEPQNPIVALASRIRARQDIERAISPADSAGRIDETMNVRAQLAAFGVALQEGAKRLNAIVGRDAGVRFVRLEKPLRLRLRFREKRVALDIDEAQQLVRITGGGLEGDYQFAQTEVPALINLSKLSTDEGYREPMTASALLKLVAQDAELPRPAHLDQGPLQF